MFSISGDTAMILAFRLFAAGYLAAEAHDMNVAPAQLVVGQAGANYPRNAPPPPR